MPKKKDESENKKAEEFKLFKKFKRGDKEAKNKILNIYNEWVVNIAKKFHSIFQSIGIDELVAEGNRGILDALKRFDVDRKVKFSTYAWFWILKNIKEYITSELAIVDLPQSTLSDFRKINEIFNEEAKKGKNPSLESIAKSLKLDINDAREIISDKMNLSNLASLDKFLDAEDSSQRLVDMMEDKREKNLGDLLENREDSAGLLKMIKSLSPIEQKVIKMRFGFLKNGPITLKDAGKKLKIPAVKVKDIEAISVRKLKRLLEIKNERAY